MINGMANAKEIFLVGPYFSASRAKDMGLANSVLPADQIGSFTPAEVEAGL